MRTYLYVDGENFAIRAKEAEAKTDASDRARLLAHLNAADGTWTPDSFVGWGPSLYMSPEPLRSMTQSHRVQNGILYTPDEVYWDSLGLYVAFGAEMIAGTYNSRARIPIDKAYYYTGAKADRIKRHMSDLHAFGFAPHVLQKPKRDGSLALELKEQGITVISRPKPVDIMIATHMLDDCASNNFDRCIFVAGDVDYVPLIEAVRRRGKQVWLVAFERFLDKENRLRLSCDRFFAYDAVLALRPLPVANAEPTANADPD